MERDEKLISSRGVGLTDAASKDKKGNMSRDGRQDQRKRDAAIAHSVGEQFQREVDVTAHDPHTLLAMLYDRIEKAILIEPNA